MNELREYTGINLTEHELEKITSNVSMLVLGVTNCDLNKEFCDKIDRYLRVNPCPRLFRRGNEESEMIDNLCELVIDQRRMPAVIQAREEDEKAAKLKDRNSVGGGELFKKEKKDGEKQGNDEKKITEYLDALWEGEGRSFKSPSDIKMYLDRFIYGQDEAKIMASVIVWAKIHGHSIHSIFIGPSGCGKTEIWRQLKEVYPPIYIFDCSSVTKDGWSGDKKIHSCLNEARSVMSPFAVRNAIIVFDEFDKMVTPKTNAADENTSIVVQGEALKFVEGTTIKIEDETYDTSNMSFVFLGAFSEIYEKHRKLSTKKAFGFGEKETVSLPPENIDIAQEELIEFGVIPELMGRIGRIVLLDELTENDYYEMLKCDDDRSPMTRIGREYDTKFEMTESDLRGMASEAYTKKLGVRHLSTMLMNLVIRSIYETGQADRVIHMIEEKDEEERLCMDS